MNTYTKEQGIALLAEQGYEQGEYNPHNVKAWVIGHEFGAVALVVGEHEQEALDNAMDEGKLECMLMDEDDLNEHAFNSWDDSYTYAGNASEAIWSEYLWIRELATTNEGITA